MERSGHARAFWKSRMASRCQAKFAAGRSSSEREFSELCANCEFFQLLTNPTREATGRSATAATSGPRLRGKKDATRRRPSSNETMSTPGVPTPLNGKHSPPEAKQKRPDRLTERWTGEPRQRKQSGERGEDHAVECAVCCSDKST